ncbi:MAG: OB-fold nucleic acid binding domain-containing protein [Nanoarchaeota archaeon]
MIKISYDDIIRKIKEEKKVSDEEINSKIEKKIEQLAGLISREGAAHIVAHEYGVKVFKEGAMKISEILSGMREVEINAKVLTVFGIVSFKKESREGKVASFLVGDDTGKIRIVLWDNSHISFIENGQIREGSIIKIKNAYVKDNQNGFKELHLGEKSELILNPDNVEIKEISSVNNAVFSNLTVKKINELTENDRNVAIRGAVVQVFEPRFYEMCSECNRKVVLDDGQHKCSVHGAVNLRYGIVSNFVLDDSTNTIRIVAFREAAEKFFNLNNDELMEIRTNPGKFEEIKENVFGKLVEVKGRVTKNAIFDRLELSANTIEDLKAEVLLKELEG